MEQDEDVEYCADHVCWTVGMHPSQRGRHLELGNPKRYSRKTCIYFEIFQRTVHLQWLLFQKSISTLFLFSKFILQMPIHQKAETTKEFKLSETTLEELYHSYERLEFTLPGIFRSVSSKSTVSVFFFFFFPPFFFKKKTPYISVVFINSEEQL